MNDPEKQPAATKAAQRQAEREAELRQCLTDINALLEHYDATFSIARIVTTGADGIERSSFQVNVVQR